jgi:hypothetical protein
MPRAAVNEKSSHAATTYKPGRPVSATPEKSTRTATIYRPGVSVSATPSISIDVSITKPVQQQSKINIEAAVYSYIQAMRRLGNTRVNSGDIARALGLTVGNVNAVLPKLNEKGVKQVG